jgi:hypothetical protein
MEATLPQTATLEDVEQFVERCQQIVTDYHTSNYPKLPVPVLNISQGKRYFRIMRKDYPDDKYSGSAWAFIDSTNGDILKPASWKRPAKHARGNIFDENEGMKIKLYPD